MPDKKYRISYYENGQIHKVEMSEIEIYEELNKMSDTEALALERVCRMNFMTLQDNAELNKLQHRIIKDVLVTRGFLC
jgi:hypothetical protein